jgi:1,2-diacylglycerol 3-alpha-glucosyltransferase
MTGRHRIAVIFDNFGPYHIARLTGAARRCDLLGIEIASVSADYAWQKIEKAPFRRETLFRPEDGEKRTRAELVRRLEGCLAGFSPDVVAIPGWGFQESTVALLWAHRNRIPVVLMSESQENDAQRGVFKEWIKRRYVGLCQAALVGGTPHQAYLVDLGFDAARIFHGYDVVDNAYFSEQTELVGTEIGRLRQQYDLPERYFLASNRFIEKKNLARLLDAYSAYVLQAGDDPWGLVLLGDGPLKASLVQQIARLGLGDHVRLPGFKQYDELPVFYGLASAFIHASTAEQWGLVVNEAMASGLPVLVSARCGCAPDLVRSGGNGYTFDPYETKEIKERMLLIGGDDCNLKAMGQSSREIVHRWSPDTFATSMVKAADAAMTAPKHRGGWLDQALLWMLMRR